MCAHTCILFVYASKVEISDFPPSLTLQPAREASPHHSPYFLQESPKKLRYPSFYNLLTLTCDLRGIHALFSAHSQVDYVLFNLNTSEFSQNGPFGELNSQYLLKQGMPLRLVTINSNLGVVLDQHGGMFPISKNSAGNLRDLQLLVGHRFSFTKFILHVCTCTLRIC